MDSAITAAILCILRYMTSCGTAGPHGFTNYSENETIEIEVLFQTLKSMVDVSIGLYKHTLVSETQSLHN